MSPESLLENGWRCSSAQSGSGTRVSWGDTLDGQWPLFPVAIQPWILLGLALVPVIPMQGHPFLIRNFEGLQQFQVTHFLLVALTVQCLPHCSLRVCESCPNLHLLSTTLVLCCIGELFLCLLLHTMTLLRPPLERWRAAHAGIALQCQQASGKNCCALEWSQPLPGMTCVTWNGAGSDRILCRNSQSNCGSGLFPCWCR